MKKKILLFLTLILILTASPIPVSALPPASEHQQEGIDVSQWQGSIDFKQVAAAGIRIVYIRSSMGSGYVDPYFEQNYQRAKAAGLKVGFYHYVTARTAAQARYQAQFFVNTVREKHFDCRLAMDFEDLIRLSAEEANQIGLAFISAVEEFSGKEAVVYSDISNAASVFGGPLTQYPLWIAQYGDAVPSAVVNWSSWAGWQYTDRGVIPGIEGVVDRDRFTDVMLLQSPGPVQSVSRPQPSSDTVTYQVQPGDTLWAIARLYRTSTASIVKENNLSDPNLIYPGETLRITIRDNDKKADDHFYTVRPGNTLSGIAAKCATCKIPDDRIAPGSPQRNQQSQSNRYGRTAANPRRLGFRHADLYGKAKRYPDANRRSISCLGLPACRKKQNNRSESHLPGRSHPDPLICLCSNIQKRMP